MKAVLVIDMPNNCSECKLMSLYGIGESICNPVDWEERPSWCPLKLLCPLKRMPNDYPPYEKIRNQNFYTEEEFDAYEEGWNACIDEITGDTDGEQ